MEGATEGPDRVFIPYRTTTPLYYFPWCTIVLIAVNVVVFALAVLGAVPDRFLEASVLVRGDGLHPWQWVASRFLHLDVGHLVGNMVFLWVFGQIVEGRAGPRLFVLFYLGVGVTQSAVEQVILLGSSGGASLGASAIISGLMAAALVWAPRYDIHVFYWIFVYFGTFEISTAWLAVIYVLLDGVGLAFETSGGESLGTAALHLMGAVLGFVASIVLLRYRLVDCEGEDIFTLWRVGTKLPAERRDERALEEDESERRAAELVAETREGAVELIRGYLDEGDVEMALAVHRQTEQETGDLPLPESDLRRFVSGLTRERRWQDLKPYAIDHVRRFPDDAASTRLVLARVLLAERRPRKARSVLSGFDGCPLTPKQDATRRELLTRADAMAQAEPFELDLDDGH